MIRSKKHALAILGVGGLFVAIGAFFACKKKNKAQEISVTNSKNLTKTNEIVYRPEMIAENERKHKRNVFSDPQVVRLENELLSRDDIYQQVLKLKLELEAESQTLISINTYQAYSMIIIKFIAPTFIPLWTKLHEHRLNLLKQHKIEEYFKVLDKDSELLKDHSQKRDKLIDYELGINEIILHESGVVWEYLSGLSEIRFFFDSINRIDGFAKELEDLPLAEDDLNKIISKIPETCEKYKAYLKNLNEFIMIAPLEIICFELKYNLKSFLTGIHANNQKIQEYYDILSNQEMLIFSGKQDHNH